MLVSGGYRIECVADSPQTWSGVERDWLTSCASMNRCHSFMRGSTHWLGINDNTYRGGDPLTQTIRRSSGAL